MNDAAQSEITERFAAQHGVVSLAELRAAGFTPDQRSNRLGCGVWEQPFPGVFHLAGSPWTWKARLLAACLAGGPRGRASHRSAAACWGLPGASRSIAEITCPRWRRARHDRVVVHEMLAFEGRDTALVDAIPVTTVDVTLLGLGAVVGAPTVEQALDVAVHRHLTTMKSVRATLERLSKRGRDGCGTLRQILDVRADVVGIAESPAESSLVRLLLRSGLPAPVLQFEVCLAGTFIARVDAAYPDARIAIEYESYEHHVGRLALVRDSTRRNRLLRAGWTVITATAEDVRSGGSAIVATIREALRRAEPNCVA